MILSERETTMLDAFRKQQSSLPRAFIMTCIIGTLFLLSGLLAGVLSVVGADPDIFLHAPIYAVFGIVTLNSAFMFRNGNPQIVLLLKVVDQLLATNAPSEDSGGSTEEVSK